MTQQIHIQAARVLTTTLCGALLVACGGGGDTIETPVAASMEDSSLASIYAGRGTPATGTPATPPVTSKPATPSTPVTAPSVVLTNVRLENTSTTAAQTNTPISFGQVFAVGNLAKGVTLSGRLDKGETVPLQVDVKATHPDGSVRHAVISGIIPSVAAGQTRTMELVTGGSTVSAINASVSQLLSSGFTSSVSATLGGVRYQASADQLLKSGKVSTWLAGPTVTEWQVNAPLTTAAGVAHPHLTARFAIRWYQGAKKARVDVTMENNWAYEAGPQNFTYDAQVVVQGAPVYTKAALTHFHHARWRKMFWANGAAPTLHIKHDIKYLIATKALPNYDQSLVIPEASLNAYVKGWAPKSEPMMVGLASTNMPGPGGREDLGLLPGWSAAYLLSMDKRAKEATLGTADLAGSWSAHFRDKNTDRPISLIDYPYMTILGRSTDTLNPATKRLEGFPLCASANACVNPNIHDTSHQPAFAYLPYLVTGDYYYLEELQFWAMYSAFASNPGYRENIKGLVHPDQVRAQAWSLRTIGEAAYISPDSDRLKEHFARIVKSNLDWYNATYTNNPSANALGAITHGSAASYNGYTGIAPWMDDFVTSAMGHLNEMGFKDAEPFLKWKAKYPVMRMTGEGACVIQAAMYTMKVRDGRDAPVYKTIGEAFRGSVDAAVLALPCGGLEMATALKLKPGEMTGYSSSTMGYPSNMQPALAYAADILGTSGQPAWTMFMKRSVKPNYATSAQFAIVPRTK